MPRQRGNLLSPTATIGVPVIIPCHDVWQHLRSLVFFHSSVSEPVVTEQLNCSIAINQRVV